MADCGSHSLVSAAIATAVYKLTNWLFFWQLLAVSVLAFLSHFILDALPHGHMRKVWHEILFNAVIIVLVLILVAWREERGLFKLALFGMFFGNVLDVPILIAKHLPYLPGARLFRELNRKMHRSENCSDHYNPFKLRMVALAALVFVLCLAF
jgi:hypothetical protein